ncbi:sulfatase [Prosthecobacter sp.]|uniref:sulfatase n=1 Tax=Prosthecobacter sp. TaxID=1965333 RepID=UPI0025FE0C2E|nr:sulfatase [Prosthecobacter sp.]
MRPLIILTLLCWIGRTLPTFAQLNVLFIAVDDLNTRLGCFGDARVKTPNIDRLAARGVRFDRAYCQYPSCGPSRASVLTGLRPQTTGALNNKTRLRDALPDAMTLPQWFRKQGYHAARAGKIFHQDVPTDIGTNGLDDAASWDEVVNPRGRDKDEEHLLTVHTPDLPLPDQMAYLAAEGADAEQTDGKVADATIELLRAHAAKPFFIAAGFYRPHLPSIAPKKWFDLYALDQTTLPELPANYRQRVPAAALSSTPVWPNFGTTEFQARECILAYEATVSFVDAQIGRLLEALDEMKLADKTVIVLWGDHGFHLGEHGLWRKNSLFEESTRAPLIIAAPGVAGGKNCASPVEFIDIFPTVVAAAGLPEPKGLEGVSLLPLLRDPATPHDRPAHSMVRFREVPGRSVRTARWRYTEWGEGGSAGRELYDETADPKEMNNLADDPVHAKTCEQLKGLLK